MSQLPSCIDYITSIETPQLLKYDRLRGGSVVHKKGKPILYSGGFCVVFPYTLQGGKKVAVRCWTAHVPDADKRSRLIAKRITEANLPYFVGFEYVDCGIATSLGIFPIVVMDWVDATPLKDYLKSHLNDSDCLMNLAAEFKRMVSDLHKLRFSHGDLQHGNIMVSECGQIFLVDYDSMYVPGLDGVTDEIKGLAGYQHPGRKNLRCLSSKTDYFSELIIYTSILALSKYPTLWNDLDIEDSETLVFSQEDIDAPHKSDMVRKLKCDTDLSDCVEAIETALTIKDIEDLLPLEQAIIPQSVQMIDGLKERWGKHSVSRISEEPTVNVAVLRGKWIRPEKNESETTIDINSISKKWK